MLAAGGSGGKAGGPAAAAAPRPAIRVLPPDVAARIAAGEVIERPASVVKELLENALDAGATQIDIAIERGGIDRIRVRDDGCGIPPEQVADAFERHATSKLRSEHDLATIGTLGFRGEALAAIVAAADVDLTTRPAAQPAAAVARYRGGRAERAGAAGAAAGTTVDVRDLFAVLPARREFLRSPAAEARAVAQIVTDYALAYPHVAIRLLADGRTALTTPGTGALREAAGAVYGDALAAALLEVNAARQEADGAAVGVRGLVGPPALHRGNRAAIHLFANGRAIQSRPLTFAIEEAYAGLLPGGRHPFAILYIEVPPAQVDVNVHPRKAEVRFRHERLVFATIGAAVRGALSGSPAASAPGLLAAVGDDDTRVDAVQADARAWAVSDTAVPGDVLAPAPGSQGREVVAAARPATWIVSDATSTTTPLPMRERLPALRALGQVDLTYIVAEGPDGMYLIDQHAAHERVLYEQLLAGRAARTAGAAGAAPSQPLLHATAVALAPTQAALASEEADTLLALGFVVEPMDGPAVLLRAVPAPLAAHDPARALAEFLDRLRAEERLSGPERGVATLACRAAVMAGDRLDGEQQRALLLALEQVTTPQACPHGRPTMVHVSRAALDHSFGRR